MSKPAKLTKTEQVKFLKSLPTSIHNDIVDQFIGMREGSGKHLDIRGRGFFSFLKKAATTILPVLKVVGVVALKEILLPIIRKRLTGGRAMPIRRRTAPKTRTKRKTTALRLPGSRKIRRKPVRTIVVFRAPPRSRKKK